MQSPVFRILAVTAATWLLANSAHAQTPAGRTRAEVAAEAVAAAHAPNQNVTRGSRGAEPFKAMADSAAMQQQAIDAAHAANQNVTRGSRGADPFKPTADASSVRAQAISAAAAPDQNVTSGSRVNSKVISTMQARKKADDKAGNTSAQ